MPLVNLEAEVNSKALIETILSTCNFQSDHNYWEQLCDEFNSKRTKIEEFRKKSSKFGAIPIHPICDYMNRNVFFVLNGILENTLIKARDTCSLKCQKSPFNAVDFIAEQLWNYNPNHPERMQKYVSIHDMEWVREMMIQAPRPFFPFCYIWSERFAAIKIQAYMRGYWIRKRDDVQEMRLFWKAIVKEKAEVGLSKRSEQALIPELDV